MKDFLCSAATVSAQDYKHSIKPRLEQFAGFNLLCGQLSTDSGFEMSYTTNRSVQLEPHASIPAERGRVHGLTNSTLDAAEDSAGLWQKVKSGCGTLDAVLQSRPQPAELEAELWKLLR